MKFKEGDLVIVSDSATHEYKKRYNGKTGTIVKFFNTSKNRCICGVKLEDLRNPQSAQGLFWFGLSSLSHYKPENSEINESEETTMFENYSVAEIAFLDNNSSSTHFYALYDPEVKPNDEVVVSTGHHGFSVAVVLSISTDPKDKKRVQCGREVVCKADFSAYHARKEALKMASEMKKQLDVMLKEAQTMAIYEAFAEKNPAMKSLLERFKGLCAVIEGKSVSPVDPAS